MKYFDFLSSKRRRQADAGRAVSVADTHPSLFPFQRDLTKWAVRKARSAIFADCGLGKTRMQLDWARLTGERCLILAPLCVGLQTRMEAEKMGIAAGPLGSGEQIEVSNYEQLHNIPLTDYGAIVLDESSILKSLDGKTRTFLIQHCQSIPWRLCCTATPAPNDISEFGNHAAFLGILSYQEFLATFFVHDDTGWRLRGHAREEFWKWMASWASMVRHPSDLGYSDDGFLLPPLRIIDHIVETNDHHAGLFPHMASGIRGRLEARRGSIDARVDRALRVIASDSGQWVVWTGLNAEADAMRSALSDGIEISGRQSTEEKEAALRAFLRGDARILITKPKVAGFGLNLQCASNTLFLGLSDSYEQYYQCIRRLWRYDQKRPVNAHIVLSDSEADVATNVKRKERQHADTLQGVIAAMHDHQIEEIRGRKPQGSFTATHVKSGDGWQMIHGDCVIALREQGESVIDLSVYSPPFARLFTYTASEADLGNCKGMDEFMAHYRYFAETLLHVTKPGRLSCCHIANVASTKQHHGVIGLIDLRGSVIRVMEAVGWIYHGEVCIDKNPQAQAIRTKSKALLFVQKNKDSSWIRPALADYVLLFRKPGENAVPIVPDITNEDWIEWAHPVWYGIRESDTLQYRHVRDDADERHICPLQLPVIRRCVRLWSNPGELVLSPFAGIGSEGYIALQNNRRFLGIELKQSYFDEACKNLESVAKQEVLPLLT